MSFLSLPGLLYLYGKITQTTFGQSGRDAEAWWEKAWPAEQGLPYRLTFPQTLWEFTLPCRLNWSSLQTSQKWNRGCTSVYEYTILNCQSLTFCVLVKFWIPQGICWNQALSHRKIPWHNYGFYRSERTVTLFNKDVRTPMDVSNRVCSNLWNLCNKLRRAAVSCIVTVE